MPTFGDAGHQRIVKDQFVQLHEVFDRCRPSEKLREIFDQTVAADIRRRLESGAQRVRILEVGCGVGNWAEIIYSAFRESGDRIEYLGIDFAEPCVDSCNQRLAGQPNGRAMVADFEKLRWENRFDIVLFVEVFCHLRRRQDDAWLRNARECLAPGGSIIIIDKERYSKHGWKVRWDLFKRRALPAGLRGRPYYFPETYNTLLTTLRYPSFSHLSREMKRLTIAPRTTATHGLFSALVGDVAG